MIKVIILSLCLIGSVLFANEQKGHKQLPYDQLLSLFQSIDDDAIILGSGEKIIYVFIDPLCPYSRKFITMVSKNPIMTSKYQYHIFLYSIPRLKSTDVVSAVYMSPHPLETLLEIMVEDKLHSDKGSDKTSSMVDRIGNVAEQMDVYKRPYIFIIN